MKSQKGITLIALVITIIVMLILVAVTITMAVNGGLFGYAKNASDETKNARDAEQTLGDGTAKVKTELGNQSGDIDSIVEYYTTTEDRSSILTPED